RMRSLLLEPPSEPLSPLHQVLHTSSDERDTTGVTVPAGHRWAVRSVLDGVRRLRGGTIMTNGSAIQVRGLRKVFPGGVEAVSGEDFDVRPGELFGLLGRNGAGKSTTIGMLTGTVAPTGGSARLAGFDVATEPLAARRTSSVLFQDPVVDRPLTGRRNLEIHARLWGVPSREIAGRLEEIVEAFTLSDLIERPVATYSGGERRRLEIARTLVSEPTVLFLDEPTVGLDPRIRLELLDVIARLRERNEMTLLLTTHYLDEAERLSDRRRPRRRRLTRERGVIQHGHDRQPRRRPPAPSAVDPLAGRDARAASVAAHGSDAARVVRSVVDPHPVRARDRARPETGAAYERGVRVVHRRGDDRAPRSAQHDVRGTERDR